MGTSTLGVDNSLGDSLTGEVSELVEKVEVLSQDGAAGASGHRVLVVVDRGAGARRNNRLHTAEGDSLCEFVLFFIIDAS